MGLSTVAGDGADEVQFAIFKCFIDFVMLRASSSLVITSDLFPFNPT